MQCSYSLFGNMWSVDMLKVEKMLILSRRSRWNCPQQRNINQGGESYNATTAIDLVMSPNSVTRNMQHATSVGIITTPANVEALKEIIVLTVMSLDMTLLIKSVQSTWTY